MGDRKACWKFKQCTWGKKAYFFCEAVVEYKGQRGPKIKQNCHKSKRHIY